MKEPFDLRLLEAHRSNPSDNTTDICKCHCIDCKIIKMYFDSFPLGK